MNALTLNGASAEDGLPQMAGQIRDRINIRCVQAELMKGSMWDQLCSSLDVIEDTDLALNAYLAAELGEDDGAKYLALYGALQAMFVQQDAVLSLCESLNVPLEVKDYPALSDIRDIRNASIGHPTKMGRREVSSHFVFRVSLTQESFELLSCLPDGKSEIGEHSVPQLIGEQRDQLNGILALTVKELDRREDKHKRKFQGKSLADILHKVQYQTRKLSEVVGKNDEASATLGMTNTQFVRNALKTFLEALEERGIVQGTYENIDDAHRAIDYALNALDEFFISRQAGEPPAIDEETAQIFAESAVEKLNELEMAAKGVDDYYAN